MVNILSKQKKNINKKKAHTFIAITLLKELISIKGYNLKKKHVFLLLLYYFLFFREKYK